MSKLFLLVTFFLSAPFFLLLCTLLFLSLSYQSQQKKLSALTPSHTVSYAALPSAQNSFSTEIGQQDARVELVRQFFAKYHSPLEPYAEIVVLAADTYGLDFRLLPAIAMQESNLCLKAPIDSYNCWGFGIYGGKVTRFSDYGNAIETVSRTLATKYKAQGLHSPSEIVQIYTPSDDGKWVHSVTHFMDQLQ